jgi:torulene dioxygenase
MHHRFEIFPGGERVSYRSHNGADDLERQIAETGRYPTFSFGQRMDPCQTIFRKFFTAFQTMRNVDASSASPSGINVSVTLTPDMPGLDAETSGLSTPSGARYIVAKTDANMLQIIDPKTLEPLIATTYKQLDSRLDGPLSAAHSCRDQETGDFYNYSCKFGGRFPTYKIFRIGGNDGKVDVLAEIKDAPASYIHSFAMTERFVVLCVWQAHMKKCVHFCFWFIPPHDICFSYGLSLLYYKNIAQSIEQKWDPGFYTLFYVVDRKKGGLVAKYRVRVSHLMQLGRIFLHSPICRHPRSSASILSTPSTTQPQTTSSSTCRFTKTTQSSTSFTSTS